MRYLPILGICGILVAAAIVYRQRLRRSLKGFWNASGSPFNLAVFRIVLFTTFFLSVDVAGSVWYSQMPGQLRIAPFGLHSIVRHLPTTPALAQWSATLLRIFCVLAVAGFFTRVSSWATVLLGLYVLGLSHLYGKVNHLHHHLIWFAALMAVSPCADVLSCDAIIQAWRRASAGATAPPGDSPEYALPLRFVWLLMGVIYFFPGFWKLCSVGFAWPSAGNMRLQMYSKWMEFDVWTPVFRIDHYPALCAIGGIATILFETSFLFVIFSTRLRPYLIVAGLAFHNLTNLFMRISFAPLQAMYASFLDWNAMFHWLGRRLFPEKLRLGFDGGCLGTRRFIASLHAFDIFGRVTYVDDNTDDLPPHGSNARQEQVTASLGQIDGAEERQRLGSLAACRELSARLPVFWPVWPLVSFAPARFADGLVQSLARRCGIEFRRTRRTDAVAAAPQSGQASLTVIVGTLLLVISAAFGLSRTSEAWPFACYPTFAFRAMDRRAVLTLAVQDQSGRVTELQWKALSPHFAPDHARGLQENLLRMKDPWRQHLRFQALWKLWRRNHPELGNTRTVFFYKDTLSTLPEQPQRIPLKRELLATFSADD